MQLSLAAPAGGASEKIEVSDVAFGRDFNESVVHQVMVACQARKRAGTKATKGRSDVKASGIKPWRQKGTGRARAGTVASPIWRSGGHTFAARPRDYSQKLNKKMYTAAIRSIFSELVRQERLVVVNDFQVARPKTKDLVAKLKEFSLEEALIIDETVDENLYLAARNLPRVATASANFVDPVALIKFDKVVVTVSAIKKLEELYA